MPAEGLSRIREYGAVGRGTSYYISGDTTLEDAVYSVCLLECDLPWVISASDRTVLPWTML